MRKEEFFKKINTPPYLIAGMVIAVVAHGLGWVGYETAIICVGAGVAGLIIHYRKSRKP